jgi:hypothetical protein
MFPFGGYFLCPLGLQNCERSDAVRQDRVSAVIVRLKIGEGGFSENHVGEFLLAYNQHLMLYLKAMSSMQTLPVPWFTLKPKLRFLSISSLTPLNFVNEMLTIRAN